MILLHQACIHLSESLHHLTGLTWRAVAAAAYRPLILRGNRRPKSPQRFGCGAIKANVTQELRHIVHMHLCELLHVLSKVVALHLQRREILCWCAKVTGVV